MQIARRYGTQRLLMLFYTTTALVAVGEKTPRAATEPQQLR